MNKNYSLLDDPTKGHVVRIDRLFPRRAVCMACLEEQGQDECAAAAHNLRSSSKRWDGEVLYWKCGRCGSTIKVRPLAVSITYERGPSVLLESGTTGPVDRSVSSRRR